MPLPLRTFQIWSGNSLDMIHCSRQKQVHHLFQESLLITLECFQRIRNEIVFVSAHVVILDVELDPIIDTTDSYPLQGSNKLFGVLQQVVNTKTEETLYQKVSSSPRPPPKIILKDTCQVQHEDCHQCGTSTAKHVADEGKMEPQIDFRIQGISHAAVEREEDDRIRLIGRLVHQVKNHSKKIHRS